MLRKDLAKQLDISAAMVSKLAKRGMPTHDVQAARRWRDRHLEPARRKDARIDGQRNADWRGRRHREAASAHDRAAAVARAESLAAAVRESMEAGQDPGPMLPELRAALRGVPHEARPQVAMDRGVWDALTVDVRRTLDRQEAEAADNGGADVGGDASGGEAEDMSDDEAAEVGAFWYAVAAGEYVADGVIVGSGA